MLYVVCKKTIKKENQAAFMSIAQEQIDCTRKEEGCIEYTLTACRDDDTCLIYIERWESRAHLEAHLQSEHVVRLRPLLTPLCENSELMILEDAYGLAAQ